MDSIWNCAFGVDIEMQNNTNNQYFIKCEQVFQQQHQMHAIFYMGSKIITHNYLSIYGIRFYWYFLLFVLIKKVYFHEFKKQFLDIMVSLNKIINCINPSLTRPYFWIRTHVGELVKKRKEEKVNIKKLYSLFLFSKEISLIFSAIFPDFKENSPIK